MGTASRSVCVAIGSVILSFLPGVKVEAQLLADQLVARPLRHLPIRTVERAKLIFVFENGAKAGDCMIDPSSRLELSWSPAPQGGGGNYLLHYIASMSTAASVSGDVWHIAFDFCDSAGYSVLASPRFDLPDNGVRMHPQFDRYGIDHTTMIPSSDSTYIAMQRLRHIRSVVSSGTC
jgi:hypothetical protein